MYCPSLVWAAFEDAVIGSGLGGRGETPAGPEPDGTELRFVARKRVAHTKSCSCQFLDCVIRLQTAKPLPIPDCALGLVHIDTYGGLVGRPEGADTCVSLSVHLIMDLLMRLACGCCWCAVPPEASRDPNLGHIHPTTSPNSTRSDSLLAASRKTKPCCMFRTTLTAMS